ncbi:hypothetical protein B2G71_02895 [Novosphingobium sp. PC22D]|uniref:hypothetical protein n=1 Tax=Novosphingobium sp. PC22D TaxID=1962403 RepID=UPI000BF1204C|nr:hypothetical protein [Novosphingobium sp. PC22D]PEQ14540.1 hypothetical protein B2G71_02895 [Novosphingobium sp. PC22D]
MAEIWIEIAVVVGGLLTAGVLAWPALRDLPIWRATITPLASIIGSGFLILGPILVDTFGSYGVLAMIVLCLAGYAFGAAIRYNIARIGNHGGDAEGDGAPDDGHLVRTLEKHSSWALAFAYSISVAYYLNLFGAFSARIFPDSSEFVARLITTGAYALILGAGLTKGFSLLERMEQVTVSLKLAIIAALIAALVVHAGFEARHDAIDRSGTTIGALAAVQMMFGLIVTVQGFETSRYLGNHYDVATRRRSMRLSQWLASGIYVAYVALLSVSFEAGSFVLRETAIIDMMAGVSVILGPLLIVAALAAQFSAAVADTNGSGGLVDELTAHAVRARHTYLALAAIGLALTWIADVFEIVSYASRAFALYYALQSAIASGRAYRDEAETRGRRIVRVFGFGALALLGLAAAIFGTSVEG